MYSKENRVVVIAGPVKVTMWSERWGTVCEVETDGSLGKVIKVHNGWRYDASSSLSRTSPHAVSMPRSTPEQAALDLYERKRGPVDAGIQLGLL